MYDVMEYLIGELEKEFPTLTHAINEKYPTKQLRTYLIVNYTDIFNDRMSDKLSYLLKAVHDTFS